MFLKRGRSETDDFVIKYLVLKEKYFSLFQDITKIKLQVLADTLTNISEIFLSGHIH